MCRIDLKRLIVGDIELCNELDTILSDVQRTAKSKTITAAIVIEYAKWTLEHLKYLTPHGLNGTMVTIAPYYDPKKKKQKTTYFVLRYMVTKGWQLVNVDRSFLRDMCVEIDIPTIDGRREFMKYNTLIKESPISC